MRVVLPEQKPPWMTEEAWNALCSSPDGYTVRFSEAEREVYRRSPRDTPKPPPVKANG
jgi:hypothetical protein